MHHHCTPTVPSVPGIYRITCTVSGKIYVGSAQNLQRRYHAHCTNLRRNTHPNFNLQRAFNKYGADVFTFEILELVLAPEMLTAREQFWFSKLRPFGKRGFNVAKVAGSNLGRKATPATIERLRISHRGQIPHNRGKRSKPEKPQIVHANQPSPMKGKHHTPEAIAKMKASKQGKGNYQLGKKRSLEARKNMSHSAMGNSSHAKDFIVIAPDGTEYAVHGLKGFCREHGLNANLLGQVAKGNRPHHKGWRARYP